MKDDVVLGIGVNGILQASGTELLMHNSIASWVLL